MSNCSTPVVEKSVLALLAYFIGLINLSSAAYFMNSLFFPPLDDVSSKYRPI